MLTDREIKEIKRQNASGVSQRVLAERFEVTEQAIGQVLAGKIAAKRIEKHEHVAADHGKNWPEPTARELCAGAVIAATGVTGETREMVGHFQHVLDHRLVDEVVAEHAKSGLLIVNGTYVTEADARVAQYRERWMQQSDF